MWRTITAEKINFYIKDFLSKCNQICNLLRIWSYLLEKSLMENFIFYAVYVCNMTWNLHYSFNIDGTLVQIISNEVFRWNYYPKYYKIYNFYDNLDKRFRALVGYTYCDRSITRSKFLLTDRNFNMEVTKEKDRTDVSEN